MPTIRRVTITMMEELTITERKILLVLKNINKSPGPDEIGVRLLVEHSKSICHLLHTIFETSIKQLVFQMIGKKGKFQLFIKKEIRH